MAKLEITLDDTLMERLNHVAWSAGKSAQDFAEEALSTFVEDFEDGTAAKESLTSGGDTVSLKQMRSEVGLDSRDFEYSKKTA